MKLKSIYDKVYDLDERIDKVIKAMIKHDKSLDSKKIKRIVSDMANWHIQKSDSAALSLYGEKDMLKLVMEDKKMLLDIFDMNSYLTKLSNEITDDYYEKMLDDDFRRKIVKCSLFESIKLGGLNKGCEYGLVLARIFNFDLAIPMTYASYDNGVLDEGFNKCVDTYLQLGGSSNIYVLNSYFKGNRKDKYNMDDLNEDIKILKMHHCLKEKVNSIN